MEALDTVREYIGDRPQNVIEPETADGTQSLFELGSGADMMDGSLKVLVGGVLSTDYVVDYGAIIFNTPPAAGPLSFMYKTSIISDAFINDRLTEGDGEPIWAAIACLLVMANNKAMLARTVTIGGYTKNETQVARELREQATALINQLGVTVESFQSINWCQFGDRNL
jgi:hypothetical protein